MKRYKTNSVSTDKVIIGKDGPVLPLCDKCKTRDCGNPIERRNVSVYGVTKRLRVLMKGGRPHFVLGCEGFTQG